MTFLSEDPTYLAGSLVLVGLAFLMALRVTQQGKYLIWSLLALGLALVVVVIERVWVTDNERIENVVYELRRAVLASDPERVLNQLTSDVEYVQDGISLPGEATRELIESNLSSAAFEFVHIRDLQISAGRQTRRGKAEFQVYAKGTLRRSEGTYNLGTANSTWSLGFQETDPGVWKVNRITPVTMRDGVVLIPQTRSFSNYAKRRAQEQKAPASIKTELSPGQPNRSGEVRSSRSAEVPDSVPERDKRR